MDHIRHAQERMSSLSETLEEKTCNVEDNFEGTERADIMRDQTDRAQELSDELEDIITRLEELTSE